MFKFFKNPDSTFESKRQALRQVMDAIEARLTWAKKIAARGDEAEQASIDATKALLTDRTDATVEAFITTRRNLADAEGWRTAGRMALQMEREAGKQALAAPTIDALNAMLSMLENKRQRFIERERETVEAEGGEIDLQTRNFRRLDDLTRQADKYLLALRRGDLKYAITAAQFCLSDKPDTDAVGTVETGLMKSTNRSTTEDAERKPTIETGLKTQTTAHTNAFQTVPKGPGFESFASPPVYDRDPMPAAPRVVKAD